MKTKPAFLFLAAALAASALSVPHASATVSIVAAENFYGGVAAKVVGTEAQVTSILSNPNQDPHEFQADAATARAVADADIVIYSGIGYDNWMERLLAIPGKHSRTVIQVASLIGAKPGDNPHIWYDPKTMPALADKLAEVIGKPEAAAKFDAEMAPMLETIKELKPRTRGVKVTATEPVFGDMARALGLEMLNPGYQLAVMNDTEPSFQQTADFEESLKSGTAKILFFNSQVTDPSTERMKKIAQSAGVPVVGVTETQPPGERSYVDWMTSQLKAVSKVLPQ